MKQKVTASVISQKEIAPNIFDMWIATDLAAQAVPGQFICVYPKDRSTLLPRPISICEVNEAKNGLRIVYRIAGQGTTEFSHYQAGETIDILGTLGNGFPVEAGKGKKVFLFLKKFPFFILARLVCSIFSFQSIEINRQINQRGIKHDKTAV